jgi:hypothetical protein
VETAVQANCAATLTAFALFLPVHRHVFLVCQADAGNDPVKVPANAVQCVERCSDLDMRR